MPYSPQRRELVHHTQPGLQQPMVGQIPLRIAIFEIYSQMANKRLLPKPPCMRGQEANRDKSRYYEYQREYGHDTNEYRMLKVEMEKLIKRGDLKKFVNIRGRPQPRPRSPQRENRNFLEGHGASPSREENRNRRDPSPRLAGRIDTISGGYVGGGDSRNSRKNYVRREAYSSFVVPKCIKTILSSDLELQGVELPHDDPVVIAPVIANYTVDRILVDTGISANILYLSTYDKLGLSRNMLRPMHTPLTEFTGHSVYPA
ncbi:hypothetical protein LIER_19410 [Lithospermum erythrorhizon]|uniref:Uncharacterized protein n=1 Tax=Lithospermum erythrorhizon TaxID=34254 RepID=A0AAV3QKR1_LITER